MASPARDDRRREESQATRPDGCEGEFLADYDAPARPSDVDPATVAGKETTSAPRQASSPVPKQLGPYVLGDVIGSGGMGVVYRARNTKLGTPCAVKVLIAGEHASAQLVARFEREARSVAKLGKQPNIVEVFDLGREGSLLYLAMELIEGEPLDKWREKAAPTWPQIASLAEKVARALHCAHENGIVHRDVKPQNILVRRGPEGTPEPQVADFGLARDASAATRLSSAGNVMGTPEYMAPEQAGGKPADARTDVYGLGAVLYELLARRLPHTRKTLDETLASVRNDEVVPPRRWDPGIPRDLETVCLKCLERDPARRYQTAGALAEDLARFVAGEPVRARRVGAAEKALRWCRRRQRFLAAAAGVLAIAAVAWAWNRVAQEKDLLRLQRENADQLAVFQRAQAERVARVQREKKEEMKRAAFQEALRAGDGLEKAGEHAAAVGAYDAGWEKSDEHEREELLERMIASCLDLADQVTSPAVADSWRAVLAHGPERSFGAKRDLACALALVNEMERVQNGYETARSNPEKRPQMLARIRVFLGDADGGEEERNAMQFWLAEVEKLERGTSPAAGGAAAGGSASVGDEPKSKFLPDGETSLLKKTADNTDLGGWERGSAAYVVATRLEQADENEQALPWYRKAVEWMRVGNPFYSFRAHWAERQVENVLDGQGHIVSQTVGYKPHWDEDSEPARLFVKADAALRRLDPKEPPRLRGGLVLTLAPQGRPERWFPRVQVSLKDKKKGEHEYIGYGPSVEVSIPQEGAARIGVADGTYAVHLEMGAQNTFETEAAKEADPTCELDFEKADLEVTVNGDWKDLPVVRVRGIELIRVTPEEGAKGWEPKKDALTWTEVKGAARYRVTVRVSAAAGGNPAMDNLQAEFEGTTVRLEEFLAKVEDRAAAGRASGNLAPGCTLFWGVDALDASGKRLGTSGELRAVVVPEAKAGK